MKVMIGLNGRSDPLGTKETRLETTASVWKPEGRAGEKVKIIIGLIGRSRAHERVKKRK